MAAGDFSATAKLEEAVVKLGMVGLDSNVMAQYDYTNRMKTLQAVNAEGSVVSAEAADGSDMCNYKVHWIDDCSAGTTDVTLDLCDIADGIEPESVADTRTLTQHVNRRFKLRTEDNRCNHVDDFDKFQRILFNKMGEAHVEINNYILGILDGNLGAGDAATIAAYGWTQAAATDPISIPTAQFNSSMAGNLARLKRVTRMMNPYNLSLSPLFEDYVMSGLDSGNPQNTEAARFSAFGRMYFDLENVATVTGGDDDVFVINQGAVKFLSHNYVRPDSPGSRSGDPQVESIGTNIASPWVPGLTFDLYHSVDCETSTAGRKEYVDVYNLVVHYDALVAPPSTCNTDYTGIWKLRRS